MQFQTERDAFHTCSILIVWVINGLVLVNNGYRVLQVLDACWLARLLLPTRNRQQT